MRRTILIIVPVLLGTTMATNGAAMARPAATDLPLVVTASLQIRPDSGPGGTSVDVRGEGFTGFRPCYISIWFKDADGVLEGYWLAGFGPTFKTTVTIPEAVPVGAGSLVARQGRFDPQTGRCTLPGPSASATFTVTP